jgi:3D (Asp-Asp-Asp) domain-containing protein
MKRFLACLATIAFATPTYGVRASAADAPTPALAQTAQAPSLQPAAAAAYDPIADLIAGTDRSAVENASDWKLRATLYHGGRGMRGRDSLGCPVSAMRTVAADRALVSRHSIIFIKETVGMPMPDGGVHDGYWYVSDIGGAIRGERIDLFTGQGAASMRPMMGLNLKTLTVSKVGEFSGCPPIDGGVGTRVADATN